MLSPKLNKGDTIAVFLHHLLQLKLHIHDTKGQGHICELGFTKMGVLIYAK
jgi:hypothetical protein